MWAVDRKWCLLFSLSIAAGRWRWQYRTEMKIEKVIFGLCSTRSNKAQVKWFKYVLEDITQVYPLKLQGRIMVPPGPEAWKQLRVPRKNCNFSSWKFRGPNGENNFHCNGRSRPHIGTWAPRHQPHQPHGWPGTVKLKRTTSISKQVAKVYKMVFSNYFYSEKMKSYCNVFCYHDDGWRQLTLYSSTESACGKW